ncbi:MAG TPA: L-rhamnose/proton symporter RhaT [Terriglobales bacterium]|nr:L-rhamnose/proton symporter RhaT [Terriglobales bacterium]
MTLGLSVVILAAVLQGIFLLPMVRARGWAWEHTWLAFSLTGMIALNWVFTLFTLPDPAAIYGSAPQQELVVLCGFGLCWGLGAILFGMGMDMIGLTLGYPLIMGLNASVGTFVPLLRLCGTSMFAGRRLLIAAGTAVAIAGISACSIAGARRESHAHQAQTAARSRFVTGLIIAVASGFLSCLPNIGLTYGTNTLKAAHDLGASAALAGNAVWFIFFTCGGIVNVLYCFLRMVRRKNLSVLFARSHLANWGWILAMGAMWIGSFYLYGTGAAQLGAEGGTIGWPIFVSLSIAVGVLCGMGKGEWSQAPLKAKTLLWEGLALLILAVLIIPFGTASQ